MKAYIYGRYSSHNQKDTSIEQQFREIREFCERNDIEISGEYADRALTGRTDKRPEFQRMIKDAAKGRVQLIVCWKVDRFARNREDAAVYKGRLRRHGVRVLYAKESIPDGPEGILLEGMLESTAEYYSAALSQNIKRGMKENALECKVNNGNLALGYQKGADGRFALEPIGAAVVREIFEMYASGLTATQIIHEMNAHGIRTSRGSQFNKNSLRKMLKNERYTGVYIYSDIRIEGGMPQIITRELFDMVQEQIAKTSKAPASSRTEIDYLLTGKLFCGHCGSSMIGESGTGKSGAKFNYYICASKKRQKSCHKKTVKKKWIEREVVKLTVERVLVDEVIDLLAESAVAFQKREKDDSMLRHLQGELSEVQKRLKNLLYAIEQGIVTATTKERMNQLESQRINLELAIEQENVERIELTKEQIIFWLEKFRNGNIDDEKYQARIIEMFVNAVYLYDDEIRIAYNYCRETATITKELVENVDNPDNPASVEMLADNRLITGFGFDAPDSTIKTALSISTFGPFYYLGYTRKYTRLF